MSGVAPVFTLSSSDGRIVAFINLIRDGVPGEGTFDLMRHRPDAPNGSMDALLVRLAEHLRDHGYSRMSLGMVPFADVGTGEADPVLERGLRLLVERMERFFSYRGLRIYKEKFHPIWEPRYLIFQSRSGLAADRAGDHPADRGRVVWLTRRCSRWFPATLFVLGIVLVVRRS